MIKIYTNHHQGKGGEQASILGVSSIFQTACPWMGHTHANQWADKSRHCGDVGSESWFIPLLPNLHCVAHPIICALKMHSNSLSWKVYLKVDKPRVGVVGKQQACCLPWIRLVLSASISKENPAADRESCHQMQH